ncbi:MAG: nitroreductase family protein [Bacteroidaceae bacterium]|nr:nitroreductase family protein [Bacteroidaceae bacterium]
MNKYKLVSLVLAIALIASLARLVMSLSNEIPTPSEAVVQNILSRKSVRSYTDRPVPRTMLDSLVRLGMAAPTGIDARPWQFIIFDDTASIRSLHTALPRAQQLSEATAAILVCGDTTVITKRGMPSATWMLDTSAATQNILLGAEAMGLGACWIGIYPYDDRMGPTSELLQLPEGIIPMSLISIGYPKGENAPKDKYDIEKIHFNGW